MEDSGEIVKVKKVRPPAVAAAGNTPADLIRMAVSGGADLDKLEKLLALQERWEANEARKAYHKAMAEFKKNPPEIDKDKKVSYGTTKYNHASLANVVEKITAELSKHGLSASWTTKQDEKISVTCRITHVLGHSEETTIAAMADTSGSKNSIQAIGSTISYLERYSVLSILGLATKEQDDDGKSAEPVSDEQLKALRDLLKAAGAEGKEAEFAKFLGIEVLEQLKAVDYKKAEAALIARKQAKEQKKEQK
jgi:hypothetical protein